VVSVGNALKGSKEIKRPSVRIHEDLLESFDEWVEDSEHDSRSKAIRALMREAVDDSPEAATPLQPPAEERLAAPYRKLCRAASRDGLVPHQTALRVCAGGPENLSKGEVTDLVLRPLQRRGYLTREGNIYGESAWRLVRWEA
jgi:Arc/MetJ-type ribon-helix-helix transcriptional regulator